MSDPALEASEPEEWRRSEYPRWAVLDPAGEPKDTVFSTVYVKDELLINYAGLDVDPDDDNNAPLSTLRSVALQAGWDIHQEPLEDPWSVSGDLVDREIVSESRRVRITVAGNTGKVAETPDAWAVLRQLRADGNQEDAHLSLNHVITTDSMGGVNPFKANPFKANPFKANPFKANPFKANAATVGIDSYAVIGFGGLQPITYLGPAPARDEGLQDRPVVAVLDTGCGSHPWFNRPGVLIPPFMPNSNEPIGIDDPPTDPEVYPSLAVPLDGIFDDASGHGTFIAGIILQECGDAQILPVRIADGDGVILENELIGTLGRLIRLIQEGGQRIDVLNLSFSFYHETLVSPTGAAPANTAAAGGPNPLPNISELASKLDTLQSLNCVIVCSAGNEATDRPTMPAALPLADRERHIAVGALNPSDYTVALFSNVGSWVDVYAPGVSVMSTVPDTFDGGVQAGTRDDLHGHYRQTLDVDDFRGGFGVWSGTSFAAPVVAGRIAAQRLDGEGPSEATKIVSKDVRHSDKSFL